MAQHSSGRPKSCVLFLVFYSDPLFFLVPLPTFDLPPPPPFFLIVVAGASGGKKETDLAAGGGRLQKQPAEAATRVGQERPDEPVGDVIKCFTSSAPGAD
jgi:hypothetical protein